MRWNQEEIDAQNKEAQVTLTRLEFMERFTNSEQEAIYTAAKTIIGVQVFIDKLRMHDGVVHLNNQSLIDGVTALVVDGALTQQRADEVLSI